MLQRRSYLRQVRLLLPLTQLVAPRPARRVARALRRPRRIRVCSNPRPRLQLPPERPAKAERVRAEVGGPVIGQDFSHDQNAALSEMPP